MGDGTGGGAMLRMMGLAMAAGLVSGCSSLRHGGAPDPVYSVQGDLDSLRKQFEAGASIAKFYEGAPSAEKRNEFVSSRLALANLSYIQFVSSLTSDKQQLDAATDMFTLGLSVAGTLVPGVRSKSNLAAAGALALGSKSAVDKHFYFEKTAPALVAAMNAQRKQVLVRILEGANLPLAQYSFPQAVSDTHDYYAAGTLNAAIAAIQTDAGAKEAVADDKVRDLQSVTPEERDSRAAVSRAVLAIIASQDLARIRKALALLGLEGLPQGTLKEAADALRENFRPALRANPGKAAQVQDQMLKI
jgi:hypothetical protein